MSDLISRQALLDKFEPWLKVKDYNDGELNMLKAILYEIRFAPELNTNLADVGTDVPDINVGELISRQAVKHLDLFTKTYCRDKSVKDDLVFRCNQCDFQLQDGTCLVKTMARKLCPDYRDFGSMGDL